MNAVEQLINQQLGFGKWTTRDGVLARLRCSDVDDFKKLSRGPSYENDELDSPVFASKFARKKGIEHLLALANEDGCTAILNTETLTRTAVQVHFNAIFDLDWMHNQTKIVTVSGDHTAKLVDVAEDRITIERMFTGHTRSVKSLAIKTNDSSIFATGSRDGSIMLWDTRSSHAAMFTAQADKVIQHAHYSKNNTTPSKKVKPVLSGLNSITGLAFQDENTLISCSAGDGVIKVWDLRRTYKANKKDPIPKCTIPYSGSTRKCGFSNLIVDKSGTKLYASCLDSAIYCYNILTYNPNPVMRYKGYENNSFYVKACLNPDETYLLSGSSDHNAYIWNLNSPEPIVRLMGHCSEVTCVAWSDTFNATLVTCADDFKHKLWRFGNEETPENWEVIGRGQAEIWTKKLPEKLPKKGIRRKKYESENSGDEHPIPKSPQKPLPVLTELHENLNSPKRAKTEEASTSKMFTPKNLRAESPVNSPTMNLPNFNVDGCAPHLHHSPKKKADKDWLTKLRTEKILLGEIGSRSPTSPSLRLEESPRTRSAKKQRKADRTNEPRSPLLKFFRVTNSSIMKDSSCVSKASLAQEPSTD